MPEMTSHDSVRVALLNQTSRHGDHLKDALRELGAMVVYEAITNDLDRDALEGSGARIVVLNLDSDSDARIDEVYDLLDAGNYEVVFNEAQTSESLSGWDHARWARHLAAKILHKPEISTPARPPGAEAVPTPVQKSAASVPVAEKPSTYNFEKPSPFLELAPEVEAPPAPVAAPNELRARSEAPTLELPVIEEFDTDSMESDVETPPESDERRATPISDNARKTDQASADFAAELDALFADAAEPAASTSTSAPSPSVSDGLSFDLDDSLTIESTEPVAPPKTDNDFGGLDFDLGGLELENEPPKSSAKDELAVEFPAIFDQLDAAAADVPSAESNPFKADAPAVENKTAKPEPIVPPDWLLSPVEEESDETDSSKNGKSAKSEPANFGIEKVSAQDYLAPTVDTATAKQSAALPTSDGLKLELMPMEEAVAPEIATNTNYKKEAWLDGSRPAQKLRIGSDVVERVFVLGASIGGPEAVREFLTALPAGFPMLFVLAQHMGEEFLELMSAQLAKAVALTVRNPAHGERIGHGDIVVVPTTHRLKIDNEGVVTLAHLPERPTYNPSIDMVLRDMADQFGDKTGAIIFSGMAHDAIEGCQYLKSRGGVVWAQDPETCAISTMVDGVKEAGVLDFIGSPEQLAAKMMSDYKA